MPGDEANPRVEELVDKVRQLVPGAWWIDELERADVRTIAMVIASLYTASPVTPQVQRHYGEAAQSVIQEKLTTRSVKAMKRLERIGIFVGIVGIFVAIPSCIIAAKQLGWLDSVKPTVPIESPAGLQNLDEETEDAG